MLTDTHLNKNIQKRNLGVSGMAENKSEAESEKTIYDYYEDILKNKAGSYEEFMDQLDTKNKDDLVFIRTQLNRLPDDYKKSIDILYIPSSATRGGIITNISDQIKKLGYIRNLKNAIGPDDMKEGAKEYIKQFNSKYRQNSEKFIPKFNTYISNEKVQDFKNKKEAKDFLELIDSRRALIGLPRLNLNTGPLSKQDIKDELNTLDLPQLTDLKKYPKIKEGEGFWILTTPSQKGFP